MTKERKALKLALEALEHMCHYTRAKVGYKSKIIETAMSAAEEALAQPEQEPACFVYPEFFGRLKIAGSATAYLTNGKNGEYPDGVERICLFRAPPQRTWVGLTDEEREQVYRIWRFHPSNETNLHLCKAIEAKLKEKNT